MLRRAARDIRRGKTVLVILVSLSAAAALPARSGVAAQGERPLPGAEFIGRACAGERETAAAPIAPSGPQRRSLLADDDRELRAATTAYPWSTICKLFVEFPDHARVTGTGTLIGPALVLTAGHMLSSKQHGGWAQRVMVAPGYSAHCFPFGREIVTEGGQLHCPQGCLRREDTDYDIGLIRLNSELGSVAGWLGVESPSDADLADLNLHIAGYPGDRDGGERLYESQGRLEHSASRRLFYRIVANHGDSGAALFVAPGAAAGPGSRYFIVGVHTNHNDADGCGTRIIARTLGWIREVQGSAEPHPLE